MKVKDSKFDYAVYVIVCILTVGAFWLLRILISEGVRQALKSEK